MTTYLIDAGSRPIAFNPADHFIVDRVVEDRIDDDDPSDVFTAQAEYSVCPRK
jgi:hypothetical protein